MTECPNEEQLQDYLGDRASSNDVAEYEKHFEVCKACQAKLNSLSRLTDVSDAAFTDLSSRGQTDSVEESRLVERLSSHFVGNPKVPVAGSKSKAANKNWFAAVFGLEADSANLLNAVNGVEFADRYVLHEVLGVSAMSIVVSATDKDLNRDVVIKVPSPSLQQSKARFAEEARVVGALEHPNIVPVYDIGTHNGHAYVTYKKITGETLAARLDRESPIAPDESVSIVAAIADALQYAHQHDVYHRDVKAANIMIDQASNPILLDFGLAVRDEHVEAERSFVAGTLPYMAPEQIDPTVGPLDGRTDVYGLGVVLYESVCGRRPFQHEDRDKLRQQILSKPARPLRQLAGNANQAIEDVCTRCLQKQPQDRFQSVAQLRDALLVTNSKQSAAPLTKDRIRPAQKPTLTSGKETGFRLSPRLIGGLSLVLLVGAIGFAIQNSSWNTSEEPAETKSAQQIEAIANATTSTKEAPALRNVESFVYLLQADANQQTRKEAIKQLSECGADLVILDVAFDGDDAARWTREELQSIVAGKPGRKVIAYFSIGEAEDFRAYWIPDWDANQDGIPDKGAPAFLAKANPDWSGNYLVNYWESAWKEIVHQQLDKIIAQGFDGIFLDRVDTFEDQERLDSGDYESDRINPVTNQSYRKDMLDLVFNIAGRARSKNHEFVIVPQNGSQLLDDESYLQLVDGIALEELLYYDNEPSDEEEQKEILQRVSQLSTGKQVLLVEYVVPRLRQTCINKAREFGFNLLITDKELSDLGDAVEPD